MSYIQKEIGGRLRGLKFNTLSLREFMLKVDWERYAYTANYAMIWAGLFSNAYAKQEEVDFTFEQVIDWCDELTQTDFDEISNVMASTESYKKFMEAIDQHKSAVETPDEKKSESVNTLQPA